MRFLFAFCAALNANLLLRLSRRAVFLLVWIAKQPAIHKLSIVKNNGCPAAEIKEAKQSRTRRQEHPIKRQQGPRMPRPHKEGPKPQSIHSKARSLKAKEAQEARKHTGPQQVWGCRV